MYPNLSRVEKLLSVILGFQVNLEQPQSRLEEILKSIIDGTTYTKPPLSRLEEDFLKFMNETGTITNNLSRIESIMKTILEGTEYRNPILSRIEGQLKELRVDTEDNVLYSSDQYSLRSSDNYRLLTRR